MSNFKFKIERINANFKGIAFSNRQIHAGLFNELNTACHTVINRFNGKLDWCELFVKFEHNGKHYEQIKSEKLCFGCVFNTLKCEHPYFETKPHCDNKIYIQTK
jgi:hypothetical protein